MCSVNSVLHSPVRGGEIFFLKEANQAAVCLHDSDPNTENSLSKRLYSSWCVGTFLAEVQLFFFSAEVQLKNETLAAK